MTSAALLGRNVDLGNRLVHLVEVGGARPTVALLGGCGVPYYQWDEVVAEVTPLATVRLDRPGLSGTPWPGVLPTLAAEVATLEDLLQRVDGPVVLVAHSMAGPHAEAFARRHPGRLIGLVLVDSSVDPNPRPLRSPLSWLILARVVHALAIVPPVRLLGSAADRALLAGQSRRRLWDPAPPVAKVVYRNRDAMASVLAEQAASGQQLWDLQRLREHRAWPVLPTVVLTAGGQRDPGWVEVQSQLAQQLGADQVVLPDARHMIMLDEPGAVAAAIRTLL